MEIVHVIVLILVMSATVMQVSLATVSCLIVTDYYFVSFAKQKAVGLCLYF